MQLRERAADLWAADIVCRAPSLLPRSSRRQRPVLIGVAAALVACVGYGVASVLQSYGARASSTAALSRGETGQVTATGGPTLRSTIDAALTGTFIVGVVLDVIGFGGSVVAARLIPLFLAQTIISANLVVTAVLSVAVLGVRLHIREWTAIGAVIVSLSVLGLASGNSGGGSRELVVHWGVLTGSVLILLGGLGLIRLLGSRAAVAAGLFAGVLFGALAIAVRVCAGVDPLRVGTLLADPASWTILIAGLGGFYLYTVALQLGSVNAAVAALVVGETVLPGVIGVILLGDTSQSGLGWLVALGFVSAVVSAVSVAIFGAVEHATTLGERAR